MVLLPSKKLVLLSDFYFVVEGLQLFTLVSPYSSLALVKTFGVVRVSKYQLFLSATTYFFSFLYHSWRS